jgi:hypothetical protein
MIYAPTELALVDFDGLFRTASPLRAALQVHQHGLSAELAPVSHGSGEKALLCLGNVGRYAAHDVVCEEYNLLESVVILLKSRTVSDRHGSTCPPPKSPSETVLEFWFRTPRPVPTASVMRHLAAKQSHVLQKLDANLLVAEEIYEK